MTRYLLVIILLMISAGHLSADPLLVAVRSLDIKMFNEVLNNQPAINATDSAGMTPLHHACSLGAVEMVEALLKHGADPKLCSNDGRNALHHAVSIPALCFSQSSSQGAVTICPLTIPLLLASASLDINAIDATGETALHIAARNGLVGVIASLLQAGANPDCINRNGETPLHLVGGSMPHLAAQVLLVNGAKANLTRNDGALPVDLAASASNALLVNMIKRYASER